jgi:hypothetical protein
LLPLPSLVPGSSPPAPTGLEVSREQQPPNETDTHYYYCSHCSIIKGKRQLNAERIKGACSLRVANRPEAIDVITILYLFNWRKDTYPHTNNPAAVLSRPQLHLLATGLLVCGCLHLFSHSPIGLITVCGALGPSTNRTHYFLWSTRSLHQ